MTLELLKDGPLLVFMVVCTLEVQLFWNTISLYHNSMNFYEKWNKNPIFKLIWSKNLTHKIILNTLIFNFLTSSWGHTKLFSVLNKNYRSHIYTGFEINACLRLAEIASGKLFFGLTCPTG